MGLIQESQAQKTESRSHSRHPSDQDRSGGGSAKPENEYLEEKIQRACLLAFALYFVCRGLLLAGLIAPWQGPDEPGHVEYVLNAAQSPGLWPKAPDLSLSKSLSESLYATRFYSRLNEDAPGQAASELSDIQRLQDAPTQIGNETPLAYLPYFPVAWMNRGANKGETQVAAGNSDPSSGPNTSAIIERQLFQMRLVSLLMAGLWLSLAWRFARDFLEPKPLAYIIALGSLPMFSFMSSVVNADLAAGIAVTLWLWFWRRLIEQDSSSIPKWTGLLGLALLAGLTKRSAVFLLPLTILLFILEIWHRNTDHERAGKRLHRIWPGIAVLVLLIIGLFGLWQWPENEHASGWERVGRPWGPSRSQIIQRSGDASLFIADEHSDRWQYLERWVDLPPGHKGQLRASAYFRAASLDLDSTSQSGRTPIQDPGPEQNVNSDDTQGVGSATDISAQLVINDDEGRFWGDTRALQEDWQSIKVSAALEPTTPRIRIALVPGQGTAAGQGQFFADDIELWIDDQRLEINGSAEETRPLGHRLAQGLERYFEFDRFQRVLGFDREQIARQSAPDSEQGDSDDSSLALHEDSNLDSAAGSSSSDLSSERLLLGLGFLSESFWAGFGWLSIWPQSVLYRSTGAFLSIYFLIASFWAA